MITIYNNVLIVLYWDPARRVFMPETPALPQHPGSRCCKFSLELFWTNDCKKLLAWTGLMNNTRLLWSCSIILSDVHPSYHVSLIMTKGVCCVDCLNYMMSNIRKKHHYCQWSCPFFQSTVIWFLFHGKNEQLFSDLCLCLIKFTHWHLDPDIIKET